MTQNVLCEVNSCKNWEQGNRCSAELIYVISLEDKQPSEMQETSCKTYEPSAS